jgi:hypothetical protein
MKFSENKLLKRVGCLREEVAILPIVLWQKSIYTLEDAAAIQQHQRALHRQKARQIHLYLFSQSQIHHSIFPSLQLLLQHAAS